MTIKLVFLVHAAQIVFFAESSLMEDGGKACSTEEEEEEKDRSSYPKLLSITDEHTSGELEAVQSMLHPSSCVFTIMLIFR